MSEFVIFEDDTRPVGAWLEGGMVWLIRWQMSELFGKDLCATKEHPGNVFEEGELNRSGPTRKLRIVRHEGVSSVRELGRRFVDDRSLLNSVSRRSGGVQ